MSFPPQHMLRFGIFRRFSVFRRQRCSQTMRCMLIALLTSITGYSLGTTFPTYTKDVRFDMARLAAIASVSVTCEGSNRHERWGGEEGCCTAGEGMEEAGPQVCHGDRHGGLVGCARGSRIEGEKRNPSWSRVFADSAILLK